jgi:hypothetical protein
MALGEGSAGVQPIGFRTYADDTPCELDRTYAYDSTGELQTGAPSPNDAVREGDGTRDTEPTDRPSSHDHHHGGRGAYRWIAVAGVAAALLGVGAGAGAGITLLETRAANADATKPAACPSVPIATATASLAPMLPSKAQAEKPVSITSIQAKTPTRRRLQRGGRKWAAHRHHRTVRPLYSGFEENAPLLTGLEERMAAAQARRADEALTAAPPQTAPHAIGPRQSEAVISGPENGH